MSDNKLVDLVPKIGTREKNNQKRRKHLAQVVTKLAAEKGFDAISVSEVAEHAQMSVGGVYRYISTKHDLLEMVCDDIHLDSLDELKQAAKSVKGITPKLVAAYSCYWHRHWHAHTSIAIAYREYKSLPDATQRRYLQHQNNIAAFFGDIIRAGILTEEFVELDEKILAHEMIFLAHMRALKGWALQDSSPEQLLAEHLQLVLCRLGVAN